MKFVLNEQYILDERFILDEGINEDKAKIEHILQRINECRKDLGSATRWIDNLNSQIEQVNKTKNALEKIPDANNKLTKTKQLQSSIKNNLNNLLSGDWSQRFIEIKNELYKPEQSISLDLLSNYLSDIYKDIKNVIKYINDTLEICSMASQKLNNTINKNIENLSDEDKNKLDQIYQNIDKNLVSSDNGAQAVLKSLKNCDINAAETACKNIDKILRENILSNTVIDWNELMQNSAEADLAKGNKTLSNLDSTANQWFDTVWKGYNIDLIKGLFDTIKLEIDAYSWNEYKNPFIKFLKYAIKKVNTFADAVGKDAVKYGLIHNAVIDNLLSEEDLEGTGELGRQNIIFNPAFYTKSTYEMEQYLLLQRRIIDDFSKQIKDENSVIVKAGKYDANNPAQCVIDIFYTPGNIFKKQDGQFSAANLRDYKDVNEISVSVFGETFNTQLETKAADGKILITNGKIAEVIKTISDALAVSVGNDENKLSYEVGNIIKAIDKYSHFSTFLNNAQKQSYLDKFDIDFETDKIDDATLKQVIGKYFNEYSIMSFDRNPILAQNFISQLCNKH